MRMEPTSFKFCGGFFCSCGLRVPPFCNHWKDLAIACSADRERSLWPIYTHGLFILGMAKQPDPNVPFADSVGVLAEMRRAGKIRHIGLSNVSVRQLEEARRIVPIVSVQNQYNMESRHSEDVLKVCEQLGITFIPWVSHRRGLGVACGEGGECC